MGGGGAVLCPAQQHSLTLRPGRYSDGNSCVSSTLAAFAKRGDLLVVDEGLYESLTTGATLSRSNVKTFRHNDAQSLRGVLEKIRKEDMKRRRNAGDQRRFIVVEGVYRMYGRERERSGAGPGCDGLYAPSACAAGGVGGGLPPRQPPSEAARFRRRSARVLGASLLPPREEGRPSAARFRRRRALPSLRECKELSYARPCTPSQPQEIGI